MVPILNFLWNDINGERGAIIHKRLTITVQNHPSIRRNVPEMYAIILGLGTVHGSFYDLQEPKPQNQNAEHHKYNQRYLFELFAKNLY